jgi:hypothetical protein
MVELRISLECRLLKNVQMQGGTPQPECGVLEVRRSERPSVPTPQVDVFQPPVR